MTGGQNEAFLMHSGSLIGRRPNPSLLTILLWGQVFGLTDGLLTAPLTLLALRPSADAFDESRWMTDLLGRSSRAPDTEADFVAAGAKTSGGDSGSGSGPPSAATRIKRESMCVATPPHPPQPSTPPSP